MPCHPAQTHKLQPNASCSNGVELCIMGPKDAKDFVLAATADLIFSALRIDPEF